MNPSANTKAGLLALAIFGFPLAGSVSAQDEYRRALGSCGDTRDFESTPSGSVQLVQSFAGWTGNCVDGKRDGRGVLDWSTEAVAGRTIQTIVDRMGGQFVKGVRAGLWCTTRSETFRNGKLVLRKNAGAFAGCRMVGGARGNETYRKLADGRWRLYNDGRPAVPPVLVAAGVLEEESARLLAAAKAGAAASSGNVAVQISTLDAMARESGIWFDPNPGPVALKDKRVALVFSSGMAADLERFRRERQALIAATSGLAGEAAAIRVGFIEASDSERWLAKLATVAGRHAREVRYFDGGLAGLRKAGYDYAVVLDWKYVTRLDLQGKYDAYPTGSYEAMLAGTIPPIQGESMTAFLVTPDLKAVRWLSSTPMSRPKDSDDKNSSRSGDSGYLLLLTENYQRYFGTADNLGVPVGDIESWLKVGMQR